jgi:L-lactate dehydrogenase
MEDIKDAAAGGQPRKIGIVGAGMVGASTAYALVIERLASDIVLVDIDTERAQGEAMDLNHTVPFVTPTSIHAGDYEDLSGADCVLITAGVAQKAGESRLVLVERNVEIFKDIVPKILEAAPEAVILVVTNPVDVLTAATIHISGLPPSRVLGSGTVLDTARFRFELGRHFGVDARNVHAYILGEHGDSEVPIWSCATIAGMPLDDFCKKLHRDCKECVRDDIFERVKNAAYEIIRLKGSTYYAIGLGTVRILESILRDQQTVMSCSTWLSGQYGVEDLCFSLPVQLGRSGIVRVLDPPVSDDEADALRASARILREALEHAGF